ncbi:MAG: hypothetical protein ACPGLV_01170 [Bacteroidia bacterium]
MKALAYIAFAILFLGTAKNLSAIDKTQALDSFAKANELYKANEFEKALITYNTIYDLGFESADLYYNMGNAYYKTDNLPLSIWCYEKTLLIEPKHSEAQRNLELANLSVADKVQELPRIAWWYYWQKFKKLFTLSGWTIISIIFTWLLAAGILLLLTQKHHWYKRLGVYFITVGFVFTLISGAIAANKSYQLKNPKSAIIITSNVYAKSAPEENSADLFIVHSGLKISIDDEIGEWAKIKLADGKMGWITKTDLKSL